MIKKPGFATIAMLTLASGIGANAAIFSIVNAVLFRPLPYPDPDRLVMVWTSVPEKGVNRFSVSPQDFQDWRAKGRSFEEVALRFPRSQLYAGQATVPTGATRSIGSIQDFDARVKAAMDQIGIPGSSIVVVKDGKVVRSSSYGFADIENKIPVTTETVYRLGSITKVFTSTAIMILVDQGKVSLDNPVQHYIKVLPEKWGKITVRQILNHTSGVADVMGEDLDLEERKDVIRQLASRSPDFAPGEKWSYNQMGYVLAGALIESLTGKALEVYFDEVFFNPLGISARWGADNVTMPGRATQYEPDRDGKARKATPINHPSWLWNATGLNLRAIDLANWDAALSKGRFLKAEFLRKLWSPALKPGGTEFRFRRGKMGYSNGWALLYLDGHKAAGHEGGTSSFYWHFHEDKTTVIVLTNYFGSGSQMTSFVEGVARLILAEG